MKSASSSSWIAKPPNYRSSPEQTLSYQVPLTPSYISPRSAPNPPGALTQKSSFKSIQSVFQRKPRAPSLRSAYSASTTTSSSDNHSSHPYAAMHMAPLPVVSSHAAPDDDDECPVCLEPLSFSFRLPGEKPHIVPECGHALHEVLQTLLSLVFSTNIFIRLVSLPFMAPLLTKGVTLLEKQTSVSVVYAGGP